MNHPESEPEAFEAEGRTLCPDGTCTGLIGEAGRCRVCGRALAASPDDGLGGGSEAEPADEGPFDADRALCPDGSCLGLLGQDGRCKICGLEARPGA